MVGRVLLASHFVGLACAGLAPFRADAESSRGAFGFTEEALAAASYYPQLIDHFTAGAEATFQQAFYTNKDHFDGSGPVFLYIGGEGPLSSGSVVSNFIVDWLPKTKGLLFSLEHRYYGCHNISSCPYTPSTSVTAAEEMKYLTTDQALADLAGFARHQQQFNGLSSNPWVLIGGSYPGMLAAFGRAQYPDVFACAVASSAPVHGQLDFQTFQQTVTRGYAMNVEGVEGSSECSSQIAAGHEAVKAALLSPTGRAMLAKSFPSAIPSAAWLEDPTNARTFAGCGVASFPAQSNRPSCTTPGGCVTEICKIMTSPDSGATPLDRLATLAAVQATSDMTHTCEMDWEMPGDVPLAKHNYWGYQCCTEYGFYQTCEEGTECFYSQGLVSFNNPAHQPDNYCAEQFGITRGQTTAAIEAMDQKWTSLVNNATKILWVNGDLDPWHTLSNLDSPAAEQPVIWPVKGAHHCAWMSSAKSTDQQSVKDARTTIYETVSSWLSLDTKSSPCENGEVAVTASRKFGDPDPCVGHRCDTDPCP